MALKFLGRGSGFSDEHTSAYFTENSELILIDCPVTAFQKLKRKKIGAYKNIYILITHTHGDHIGGLSLFVQYIFFVLDKKMTIVAPNQKLYEDISTLLQIEDCNPRMYNLVKSEKIHDKSWFINCIQTYHSPGLKEKSFGYQLQINKKNVIYTGDTATLEPFIPYLTKDSKLYVDTSVYHGNVHLKLEDALEDFCYLTKKGVKIYLMHLDDAKAAEKIVADYSNIKVVRVEYSRKKRYFKKFKSCIKANKFTVQIEMKVEKLSLYHFFGYVNGIQELSEMFANAKSKEKDPILNTDYSKCYTLLELAILYNATLETVYDCPIGSPTIFKFGFKDLHDLNKFVKEIERIF